MELKYTLLLKDVTIKKKQMVATPCLLINGRTIYTLKPLTMYDRSNVYIQDFLTHTVPDEYEEIVRDYVEKKMFLGVNE